ncbi:hypothetical protein K493DRAFT_349642 [Basidiobolus meristosporus CBS 931.73]|uniref:Uncharacterized protein n=1 Tax=Basidiobolus meristosporus CBS 931.73 TaxID=1314790 RepID=A0A1Y1YJP5_9FUNG|nr:hypothetical protein K493DRAFT_349642 [Basidiobolus meristosporus CBS 931.73]|eukprot:ORX97976.1 hypothetical protein K493DRAFT_349642 [Basidiobolus meristosporus CBS 931.73]
MANSYQYIIRDSSVPWQITDTTDPKYTQICSRSNSLGSCFSDDESEDEYWGRYDQGQIQTPIKQQSHEESSDDDYWAQYDGVGTETPPLPVEQEPKEKTNAAPEVMRNGKKALIKKEITRELLNARNSATEAGFSDREYEELVFECLKELSL